MNYIAEEKTVYARTLTTYDHFMSSPIPRHHIQANHVQANHVHVRENHQAPYCASSDCC